MISFYGCIYKVTCLINKKVYIGQTIQKLEARQKQHIRSAKNNSKIYFHHAISKYGEENFMFEIIDYGKSLDELNQKEIFYIQEYKSDKSQFGYNSDSGGKNCPRILSEEAKKKLSGENHPFWGKKHSPETIAEYSRRRRAEGNGMYGKPGAMRGKTKENHPKYNVKESEEACIKKSQAHKNRLKEESPFYQKTHTEESKKKMSDSHRKIDRSKYKVSSETLKTNLEYILSSPKSSYKLAEELNVAPGSIRKVRKKYQAILN